MVCRDPAASAPEQNHHEKIRRAVCNIRMYVKLVITYLYLQSKVSGSTLQGIILETGVKSSLVVGGGGHPRYRWDAHDLISQKGC